jgi:hypothetical protein
MASISEVSSAPRICMARSAVVVLDAVTSGASEAEPADRKLAGHA